MSLKAHTVRSETVFGNWKPFKNDEKWFLFHFKSFFVLKLFKFVLTFWLYRKNGLIRKKTLISSRQIKKKNYLQKKGSQRMTFALLIEYIMKNIFLENHTQNVVEKLFPDLLLKSRDLVYLWIVSLNFNTVCFYCMPSWGILIYTETKLQNICF